MEMSIDEAAFSASLAKWKEYVQAKALALKLDVAGVLKKEAGRLVSTLIRVTPPGDRRKLREQITKNISSTFVSLGKFKTGQGFHGLNSPKSGSGSVIWYAWQSDALYGVRREDDATGASQEHIENLYFSLQYHKGMMRQMAGRRGKQTIWIKQKILVTEAAIAKLTKKFQKHIGRQKASWVPAYRALGSPPGYAVPGYVEDHAGSGVKGSAIDELSNKDFPSFTVESHAVGIASDNTVRQIDAALRIRSEAMVKRTAMILEHPELANQESDSI